MITNISRCRVCNEKLQPVISLGKIPPVNDFPEKKDLLLKKYPLKLAVCKTCQLLQLSTIIKPAQLFNNYDYLSGASGPLVKHLKELAIFSQKYFKLKPGAKVLDIGSNDGSLLKNFATQNFSVLGIEPAKNIAAIAAKSGIPTLNNFFNVKLAREILKTRGNFDLIFMTHTLANILDLNELMSGLKLLLSRSGRLVIEVANADILLKKAQFDSIYHEHYSYFTLNSLKYLLAKHGFKIIKARKVSSQGGSLQVFASINENVKPIRMEDEGELTEKINKFVLAVKEYKKQVSRLFSKLKNQKVFVFGAPAKAVTFLNYCNLDFPAIFFAVDSTPLKQGKIIPGTRIPVYPENYLKEVEVDYCLLLAWNYKDEILRKLKGCSVQKIIIPFPKLEIIKVGSTSP